jgi:transcriptional regulator with XRE-family HTH domain
MKGYAVASGMSKKATKVALPKWIERSPERSQEEITRAINARAAFRALRELRQFSQPQMAKMLGVSLATVQGIESGYRPVTADVARRAQARFGVFAESLMGATKEPVTLLGEMVGESSTERAAYEVPQSVTEKEIADLTEPLVTLLRAAAKAGHLYPFGATYRDMLRELKEMLRITDEELNRELQGGAVQPTKTRITRKQLRQSPPLAKALGIADDPTRPDDEEIEIEAKVKAEPPSWFPKSRCLPEWDQFLDKRGEVRWSDPRSDRMKPS